MDGAGQIRKVFASMSVAAKKPLSFEIYRPEKKISYLKIGIYGDAGVGKTTLAATAPKPLFLNAEAGDVALRNKDIDVIRIDEFQIIDQVYSWVDHHIRNGTFEYETIVIDSLTEIAKRAMDMVLASEGRDMPHQGDWGRSMEYVRRIVRKFRDLDLHVVFVMGAVFREDSETGVAQQMPNLPGNLSPEVAGYFDILGYLHMERTKPGVFGRKLRVQPSPKWRAKDRTNTLGAVIDEDQLDLTRMLKFINGKEKNVKEIPDETVMDTNGK